VVVDAEQCSEHDARGCTEQIGWSRWAWATNLPFCMEDDRIVRAYA
jgi:hypothetical protein